MNLFTSINEGLKTVNRNYQLLIIHFLFIFVSFFGLFFILSIPLGILFVVFGIDLTDILRGSFIEIVISSLSLMKKFLLFALVFLVSLFIYLLFVFGLWVYVFSGTLGTIGDYLNDGKYFNFKSFHLYGKKFFWKVAKFAIFVGVLFLVLFFLFALISDISAQFINFLERFNHALAVFFNVFLFLGLFLSGIFLFILWITYSLIGFYGIYFKEASAIETIKEAKRFIYNHSSSVGRAALLFVVYILMGGAILSLGSLIAIIPHVGPILAAVYQFITQLAHIYITLLIFSAFFAYYLRIEKQSQPPIESTDTFSQEAPVQEQAPQVQGPAAEPQNQNPSESV